MRGSANAVTANKRSAFSEPRVRDIDTSSTNIESSNPDPSRTLPKRPHLLPGSDCYATSPCLATLPSSAPQMATTSYTGSKASQLEGSHPEQHRHQPTSGHTVLQPYAYPSHGLTPHQAHQMPHPTPFEHTSQHQLLKTSAVRSSSAPGGSLQQPWESKPSHQHHGHPPHTAAASQFCSSSASSRPHGATAPNHHMQPVQHQSPADFTHPRSDLIKPHPSNLHHSQLNPNLHHSQLNPNQPPPTTHMHCASNPTKPPSAVGFNGSNSQSNPSIPIPAGFGHQQVQQHCHQPLQDATNQQLSFEAASFAPLDPPTPAPLPFSAPFPAAPFPATPWAPTDSLGPSTVTPWARLDSLPPSRAAPWPPLDPLAPSRPTPMPPSKAAPWHPCAPFSTAPLPSQHPVPPSTAPPSSGLQSATAPSTAAATAAAAAAASHSQVVLPGMPSSSTFAPCTGALPRTSQAQTAALKSHEADSAKSQAACVGRGQADEQMTENVKASGLRLMLHQWGLPRKVVQAYAGKGVHQMYPWQAAALECGSTGSNLVYCAPTSGGKSLVAEILMIRRLSMTKRPGRPHGGFHMYSKALVILPYISVVAEKTELLTTILKAMKCKVKGYFGTGEGGVPLAPGGESVAVCTIEKANVAINKLIQEGRLGELVCVVVDELHMVCDPQRGLPLELSITKLLYSSHADRIQLIGMSATMGGLDQLRSWMRAELFLTNFRPVPLTEHAVFRGCVYSKVGGASDPNEVLTALRELPESAPRDQDRLVPLVAEVVRDNDPVLVFCASRKQTQSCAELLAELLVNHPGCEAASEAAQEARRALVTQMQEAMGGFSNSALEKLMLTGVSYHHAGLTTEERQTIEGGFRSGALLVLTATSTLAAGVNLPARRVILRSLWQGVGPVSRAQYLQMVGRAGRAGQAKLGEAFIIGRGDPNASFGDWKDICQLLVAPVPSLRSQLLLPSISSAGGLEGAPGGLSQGAPGGAEQIMLSSQSQHCPQAVLARRGQHMGTGPTSSQLSHECHLTPSQIHSQTSFCQQLPAQLPVDSCSVMMTNQPSYHRSSQVSIQLPYSQPRGHMAAGQNCGTTQVPHVQSSVSQLGPALPDDSGRGESTQQLQRMLLEAIANGSIGSARDINRLIQSTLLSHQAQYSRMQLATKAALAALRGQKLLTYSRTAPDTAAAWAATKMGRAVYDSGLPTDIGVKLYDELSKAEAGLVLGQALHLVYIIMLEHPFKIFGWSHWGKLFGSLPSTHKKVASLVGVTEGYIGQRCRGGGLQSDTSAKHARFAAACALNALLCEQSAVVVERQWGLPSTLTQQGVTRGQLQKLQTDLSKWAAMSALMCASLGWWQLEALLASLSQQAAAGVRPELLRLMDIPKMTAAHARALYSGGIVSPELLAATEEEEVKKALAAGLPAAVKKTKQDKRSAPLLGGLTGGQGTNQLVARSAKALLAAAREHLAAMVEEATEEAAKAADSSALAISHEAAASDDEEDVDPVVT